MPLYDNQPTRRPPLVSYFLIAANVVIFLISPMAGLTDWYGNGIGRNCTQVVFSLEYGAIPKELTTGRQAPLPEDVAAECQPESFQKAPWRSVLSSMFLHGGWLHLLGNMIYLFVFGAASEDRLGRLRFLLFYLAAGAIAAYGFAFTYPGSGIPLVGASGAIAGVLGAHLIMYPRSRVIALIGTIIPVRLPAWVLLGQFFLTQWLSLQAQQQSQVAYVAHIYGFVTGMAFGLLARRARTSRRSAALAGWQ